MGKLPEHKPRAGHSIRDHGQVTQSRTTGWSPEQKPFEKLLSFVFLFLNGYFSQYKQAIRTQVTDKLPDQRP